MGNLIIDKQGCDVFDNKRNMVEIHIQKIKEYDPLFEQDGYSFETALLWRNYIHYIKEALNMENRQIFKYRELMELADEFARKIVNGEA